MAHSVMPTINVAALMNELSREEFALVEPIIATQGKNAGRLRASKPSQCDERSMYIWRLVAFYVSPMRQHQCMPVTADFDLPGENYHERMMLAHKMDAIVDKVTDAIPMSEWHGIKRWGQAYGQIGTPITRENGTIVYR
jgi:hypothetical protein